MGIKKRPYAPQEERILIGIKIGKKYVDYIDQVAEKMKLSRSGTASTLIEELIDDKQEVSKNNKKIIKEYENRMKGVK